MLTGWGRDKELKKAEKGGKSKKEGGDKKRSRPKSEIKGVAEGERNADQWEGNGDQGEKELEGVGPEMGSAGSEGANMEEQNNRMFLR